MRRVRMIAPFEVLRGNVSGSQQLQYAAKKSAFDAPAGRQYANNYKPRYICAERASDGLAFFQVKQKSATLISPETLKNMALLGGTTVTISALKRNATLWSQLVGIFSIVKQTEPEGMTFDKWLKGVIRNLLDVRQEEFIMTASSTGSGPFSAKFYNPFTGNIASNGGENPNELGMWKLDVDTSYLHKFAEQLYAENSNRFVFSAFVDGMKFYWMNSVNSAPTVFHALGANFNEGFGLTANLTTGEVYLYKNGDQTQYWLLDPSGNYVHDSDTLIIGGKYKTTLVAPQ